MAGTHPLDDAVTRSLLADWVIDLMDNTGDPPRTTRSGLVVEDWSALGGGTIAIHTDRGVFTLTMRGAS